MYKLDFSPKTCTKKIVRRMEVLLINFIEKNLVSLYLKLVEISLKC